MSVPRIIETRIRIIGAGHDQRRRDEGRPGARPARRGGAHAGGAEPAHLARRGPAARRPAGRRAPPPAAGRHERREELGIVALAQRLEGLAALPAEVHLAQRAEDLLDTGPAHALGHPLQRRGGSPPRAHGDRQHIQEVGQVAVDGAPGSRRARDSHDVGPEPAVGGTARRTGDRHEPAAQQRSSRKTPPSTTVSAARGRRSR